MILRFDMLKVLLPKNFTLKGYYSVL